MSVRADLKGGNELNTKYVGFQVSNLVTFLIPNVLRAVQNHKRHARLSCN